MADKKISQLTGAATPLAGTEVLPIVQSGTTVKVSVADLTAGRTVTATNISAGLGAVGTPSYTFTGDLNTGIFSPAADTIAFVEGGAEAMRINSSGNVGIGTNAPLARITVAAADGIVGLISGATRAMRFATDSVESTIEGVDNTGLASFQQFKIGGSAVRFTTEGTERMRITSAGNVGIGTNSPSAAAQLDVVSTTRGFLPPRMTTAERNLIATPPNGLMLYNTSTDKLQVRAAGAWVDLH